MFFLSNYVKRLIVLSGDGSVAVVMVKVLHGAACARFSDATAGECVPKLQQSYQVDVEQAKCYVRVLSFT